MRQRDPQISKHHGSSLLLRYEPLEHVLPKHTQKNSNQNLRKTEPNQKYNTLEEAPNQMYGFATMKWVKALTWFCLHI